MIKKKDLKKRNRIGTEEYQREQKENLLETEAKERHIVLKLKKKR